MSSPVILKREDLHGLVWQTPMLRLAQEFGLSDRGLAKICERMEIPVPGRGYWRQLETGRKMRKMPLPKLSKKGVTQVTIQRRPNAFQGDNQSGCHDVPASGRQRDFERDEGNRIVVGDVLADAHPLVGRTATSLQGAKPDSEGMVQARAKAALDVRVGEKSVERALRIMDALIKGLDARGVKASIRSDPVRKTLVSVLDEELEISLTERRVRIPHVPTPNELAEKKRSEWIRIPEFDWVPSGKLALKIENSAWNGPRGKWADGQSQRLEDLLNSFVVGLFKFAEYLKAERVERERREREWAQREQRRRDLEQRKQEERKRIEELSNEVEAWHKAERVRAYVDAVERWAAESGKRLDPSGDLGAWATWARGYADWVDPLAVGPASVLDEVPG